MADLPVDRLEPSPPFSYCAVDYFGPWYIKEGRKTLKCYGALFTCMSSRAVHIEVANTLSTDSFLNTLRRFMAIRGPIRQLPSDQGTNFIGARNELKDALGELDQSKLTRFLSENGCHYFQFEFNVPHASHMGGVWERQICTVRSILASMLDHSGAQLDEESLRTLMYEVSAIINSRPLTTNTLNDPTSLEPLTPNHLLTQKSKVLLPPVGVFEAPDVYSSKRWRRTQYLANAFWTRWKKEYLQNLQTRQKWVSPSRNLKVDDVVLVKDDERPRNQWQLARVIRTTNDDDGFVRKVKVITGASLNNNGKRMGPLATLQRPVHKLVLLVVN